jgi:hypothetical protein
VTKIVTVDVTVALVTVAAIIEIERITINPLTSSAAILMCMAWWSSRMMAITGVCPFDPSAPGVKESRERKGRGSGEERERKGRRRGEEGERKG